MTDKLTCSHPEQDLQLGPLVPLASGSLGTTEVCACGGWRSRWDEDPGTWQAASSLPKQPAWMEQMTPDEARQWAVLREQAEALDLQRRLVTDKTNRLRSRVQQRALYRARRLASAGQA